MDRRRGLKLRLSGAGDPDGISDGRVDMEDDFSKLPDTTGRLIAFRLQVSTPSISVSRVRLGGS